MVQDTNKSNSSTSSSSAREIAVFAFKLLLLAAIVCLALLRLMPQYLYGYQASLNDKVSRLESMEGPKVVLIGNSNLAFGINSALLEEEIRMPVVNMGLHGGIGNGLHEQMAKLNVHKGDVYVVCHSDYSDSYESPIEDATLAWTTLENHVDLWHIVRLQDIWPLVEEYPIYLKKCLALWEENAGNTDPGGVYSRLAFNEYGDIKLERGHQPSNNLDDGDFNLEITDGAAKRLNELNAYLNERGAYLVVASRPICIQKDTATTADYEQFQNEMDSKLDCEVISTFADYRYDADMFYDTGLHLTTEGTDIRTRQLADDLNNWLALSNYRYSG